MNQDIGPILREWDEDAGDRGIRKIIGGDGKEKIQIRLFLGLLQMEADGRPDGKTPYGKESLLEHYLSLIEAYKEEYETDEGFKLDRHDCEKLREEATQYYYRYISLFELGDYQRAERDTARNLRVFDLLKRYAAHPDDAVSLERYRPYVIMMNARARAYICMNNNDYSSAIDTIKEAEESIVRFYRENDIDAGESQELRILRAIVKEIRDKWEMGL